MDPINKIVIYALVRGYRNPVSYFPQLLRSIFVKIAFRKIKYDQFIFHEGNISLWVRFIYKKIFNVNLIKVSSSYFINKNSAYKDMCHFQIIGVYPYIKDYEYAIRIDEDIFISNHFDNDFFDNLRNNNIDLCLYRMKIDKHKETVKYMPNFFSQEFNDNTLVEINMNHTGLFNFYNNFIIYNVSKLYTKQFFKNLDVIDKSEFIYKYRWGDSTILTALYLQDSLNDQKIISILSNPSIFHQSHHSLSSAKNNWHDYKPSNISEFYKNFNFLYVETKKSYFALSSIFIIFLLDFLIRTLGIMKKYIFNKFNYAKKN